MIKNIAINGHIYELPAHLENIELAWSEENNKLRGSYSLSRGDEIIRTSELFEARLAQSGRVCLFALESYSIFPDRVLRTAAEISEINALEGTDYFSINTPLANFITKEMGYMHGFIQARRRSDGKIIIAGTVGHPEEFQKLKADAKLYGYEFYPETNTIKTPTGDNIIAQLRREAGWSQEELAEKLGVSQPSYRDW